MRIAYICYWNPASADGVSLKIDAQLGYWRSHGHEVELFMMPLGSLGKHLRDAARAARGALAFAPDLVYLRYGFFGLGLDRVLRAVPSVLEVNGDESAELRAHTQGVALRRAKLVGHRLNRRYLVSRAAGVVCVTQELAAGFAPYGKPVVVVSNGGDPDRVPWSDAPANERPRAIFVGSPGMPWHGVDRLLELARALPEVDFDLVGPEPGAVPPNVSVRGTLAGDAYLAALTRADVAFGSLAMDRAGLREGSPLKVREYLLAGLPTVIGYEDTDFPGELPWYLARYDDAGQVRRFIEAVRGRRAPRDELAARLSWRTKEKQRLAFFDHVRPGLGPVSDTRTQM